MERKQFTFYESFASALSRIKSKAARCDAYDAICRYALYAEEPDIEGLPDAAAIAFDLIRPTLDTSKRRAESGNRGGSVKQTPSEERKEAKPKQNVSKTEAKSKQTVREKEGEKEKEIEIENDSYNPQTPFDRFWAAYPKKVGKEAARTSFAKTRVKVDVLIDAIERQKRGAQWTRENGRYIPNPATWLNQGRWEDEVQPAFQGTVRETTTDLGRLRRLAETLGGDQ